MSDLVAARFWPKVERRVRNECWPWLGSTGTKGYGAFYVNAGALGRERSGMYGAHCVAFFLVTGHWPTAALHGCDFRLCCNAENPEHVHDGTIALNNREMHERGRAVVWGKTPLTAAQRAEIAERYAAGGLRQVDLSLEYGVSIGRISRILQAAGAAPGKRRGPDGRFT